MKRIISLLLVLILTACLPASAFASTYGKAADAINGVVRIAVKGDVDYYDEYGNQIAQEENVFVRHGSGFAVGRPGEPVSYFVTNRHVISSEVSYYSYVDDYGETIYYEIYPKAFYIIMDNEANLHPIKIVSDNGWGADLAVVKLNEPTTEREACILRPYSDPEELRGLPVRSVGFPGSQDAFYSDNVDYASGKDRVSLRSGTIDHEVDAQDSGEGKLILTDTPISGGNSGGPLVDENGAVLGVCTYGTYTDPNMNAAVSVNEVVKLLNGLGIPFTPDSEVSDEESDNEDNEDSESGKTAWYIYAGVGAAIVGVVVLLVVLQGKKTPPQPPEPKTTGARTTGAQTTGAQSSGTKPQPPRAGRVLIGVAGPLKDRRFELKPGGRLLIGRSSSCNVRFKDGTPGVSSTHCEIRFDGKTATIMDLKSSYGTFVDRKKLSPNVPVTLHRSLSIDIGSEKNRFVLQ